MKLKFSIQYGTQWGEILSVVVTYRSADQTEKSERLLMTTNDGLEWQLETTVLETRKHPIVSFSYYYQVEDADGRVLRCEWKGVPRVYYFDSSKDYVMADLWRDIPLQYHLYSQAYLTTMGMSGEGTVTPLRVPLYRKTVLFRVSAPQREGHSRWLSLGRTRHLAVGMWHAISGWSISVVLTGCCRSMSMRFCCPFEYKYVIIDDETHALVAWEEGDNRTTAGLLPSDLTTVPDGTVLVAYGESLRVKEKMWRAAGVVVPVFSLRSQHSYGVGDFGDLRRLVDWCVMTGMKAIQLLPVNDTTCSGNWSDSYPYNIVSAFALHPQYIDLEALGALKNKTRMTAAERQQQEQVHWAMPTMRGGTCQGVSTSGNLCRTWAADALDSKKFKAWFEAKRVGSGLMPFGVQITLQLSADQCPLVYYVQYHLHQQLKAAADYARQKGVVFKGDLPIGVNRNSAETTLHPQFFHLDSQTGAPPDAFAQQGQNWGFPTYNWDAEEADGTTVAVWFRQRLSHMAQYFDALRIDHVLGFFRIWEIPADALFGTLGHFAPALPLTAGEIEYFGLPFRKSFLTRPFVNDRIIERLFGMHAQYVRDTFLIARAYGLYDLKEEVNTQQKVQQYFEGRGDENSLWIRDGLYRLIANVLFVEDPRQSDMYHPRIAAYQEPVFSVLSSEEQDAYMRLYNNYYYQRHNMFWGSVGMQRLNDVLCDTRMLVCAEDLGMLPDCVEPVLDVQRILTLEIQQMPKQSGVEFAHLDGNPVRSVATPTTHDMAPLRLWWEERPERTQRFYTTMLQKQGRVPEHLPAHIAEEIIARHLYCPSMLCMISLQDWLAMDAELRSKSPREERINVPSDPLNHWQYRMHLTLESLIKAERYNDKIKMMITRSKRS